MKALALLTAAGAEPMYVTFIFIFLFTGNGSK